MRCLKLSYKLAQGNTEKMSQTVRQESKATQTEMSQTVRQEVKATQDEMSQTVRH